MYVGLFAWRYGYVPRHDNPEGRSITELEYRKAIELDKDVRIFLARDQAAWPTHMTDMYTGEGETGARIRQFRSELEEQWMVSFFHTAADLASLVAAALNQALLASQEQLALEVSVASRRRPGSGPPTDGEAEGRERNFERHHTQ